MQVLVLIAVVLIIRAPGVVVSALFAAPSGNLTVENARLPCIGGLSSLPERNRRRRRWRPEPRRYQRVRPETGGVP
jgi:hypothetical protein